MTIFRAISIARRFSLFVMLFSVVLIAGCDSNEDEDDQGSNDAERIVGDWEATSISAGPLDILGIVDVSLSMDFESNGDATLTVVDEDANETAVTGTFVLDQSAGTITLDGDDIDDDLVLDYSFVDDDNLEASFPGSDLGNLGIDLGVAGSLLEGLTVNVDLVRAS